MPLDTEAKRRHPPIAMDSYSQRFRDEVETFIRERRIDPTRFGKEALRDPSFVFELRNGRSPSGKTMDRVREWMLSQAHGEPRDVEGDTRPPADAAA